VINNRPADKINVPAINKLLLHTFFLFLRKNIPDIRNSSATDSRINPIPIFTLSFSPLPMYSLPSS
jgi:hypothetical protein